MFFTLIPSFAIGADFAGLWFACYADWQSRNPFELMEITHEGKGYQWSTEWGTTHSAGGKGLLRGSRLVLRGCKSDRGETEQGCDETNPPAYRVLDRSKLMARTASLSESLRRSKWIRTDHKTWERLAAQCNELQEKIARKKNPETRQ